MGIWLGFGWDGKVRGPKLLWVNTLAFSSAASKVKVQSKSAKVKV
jgi:hypothetical protein